MERDYKTCFLPTLAMHIQKALTTGDKLFSKKYNVAILDSMVLLCHELNDRKKPSFKASKLGRELQHFFHQNTHNNLEQFSMSWMVIEKSLWLDEEVKVVSKVTKTFIPACPTITTRF